MSIEVYTHPLYYEIAFSFFDPKKQVDCFEEIIKKYSRIKVKRFLDIACGPSLQLREIARRGYEAVGLDLGKEMLEYLRKKAEEQGLKIETVQANMVKFKLRKKTDFAFIMMGSFAFKSNEELLRHLDSVSASLNRGGLYFIQNMGAGWIKPDTQSWITEKDGITVKATFSVSLKDIVNQIITEEVILEIDDMGKKMTLEEREDLKMMAPQEFKLLVRLNEKFEFLGWWKGSEDTWYLNQPLEKAEDPRINMVLLRKR
jgi:2-polyprenyl-3-methyl-5-hydroxy-6-metoxy-1,4-benzoquinol methylase